MRYVGIDQSYTGLAIVAVSSDERDAVIGGVHSFESKKYGTGIDRLLSIYQRIFGVLSEIDDIAHVCMEGYAPSSKYGREQAGELGAIVKLALYDYFDRFADDHGDLRYPTIVGTTALKKFVSGNGTTKKNNMLLSVYKKWGFETTDDNIADAFWLAKVAEAVVTGNTKYEYEKAVIAGLHPHTEMPPATIPST